MADSTNEFKKLINDPLFPKALLSGECAEERLQAEFSATPAQFARNVLTAFANSKLAKWDTPEGQALSKKLNLSKADLLRWS